MALNLRVGIAAVLLAIVGGLFWSATSTQAGEGKEAADAVDKIAEAIKEGKMDAAAKLATAAAKKMESIEDAMNLLKPRKKGGFGVGAKAGAASVDGIELMLQNIGRDVPTANQMKKEAAAIEEMAYRLAAIAEISKNFPPKKDKGQANKKNWNTWSADMSEQAMNLAKAASKKGGAEVKTAASKVNAACNSCHSAFRGK